MNKRSLITIQDKNQTINLSLCKWNNNLLSPRGTVIIVHGMKDHIERYNQIANNLVSNGYVVYGFDLRGHGQSINNINEYGDIKETLKNDYINDLNAVIKTSIKEYPKNKIYLLGHSMGSIIVNRYIEVYPDSINGVILTGAPFDSMIKLYFGKALALIIKKLRGDKFRSKLLDDLAVGVHNKKFKNARTNCDWLNRNEAEVDKYINDELCGGLFTTSFFVGLGSLCIERKKNLKSLNKKIPIYLLSGSKDGVTGFGKNTNKFYKYFIRKKHEDVMIKLYDNARHEILLEENKEEVYSDILSWLSLKSQNKR